MQVHVRHFVAVLALTLTACSGDSPTMPGQDDDGSGGLGSSPFCQLGMGNVEITGARSITFGDFTCGVLSEKSKTSSGSFYMGGASLLLDPRFPDWDQPAHPRIELFRLPRGAERLKPGSYLIGSASNVVTRPDIFVARVLLLCGIQAFYCEQEVFEGVRGGTLTIESIEDSRYRGSFEFEANQPYPSRATIQVKGTFDVPEG